MVKTRNSIFLVLLTCILAIASASGLADKKEKLEVLLSVVANDAKIPNVQINIYNAGQFEESYLTNRFGNLDLLLHFNEQYTIEFLKQGYVNQRVFINTKIPSDILNSHEAEYLYWKPQFELTEYIEGLDVSYFDEITEMYYFDNESFRFEKKHAIQR
jgi:hypothetical protein